MDAQALKVIWEAGRTEELLLDSNQQEMNRLLAANWDRERIHVLNIARQCGKSFFLVNLFDRMARRVPRARLKYAAETAKQVRAIIRPHFQHQLVTCPRDLRPVFNSMDGEFRYPNGSTITLAGCDTEDDANKLLGQHAHACAVDEAGSIKILNYVVKTIFLPQTINTRGRIVILSTPAKTADHPFKEYCDLAEARGTLIERDIYCNPRLTPAEIAELMELSGGEDSTEWQREYLVRHVTDQDLHIIKAASPRRLKEITLVIDPKNPLVYRPDFFDPYTVGDIGWAPDATGLLWGFWDYEKRLLVIENEWFMRRMTTAVLAEVVERVEKELYGHPDNVFQRWLDCEERLQHDLSNLHSLNVARTENDDPETYVNRVSLMVAGLKGGMRIHPRCKQLLEQLRVGVWGKSALDGKKGRKKSFARSAKHGHYDLLSALVYMGRNVQQDKLPEKWRAAPPNRNVLVIPQEDEPRGVLEALASMFGLN